MNKNSKFNVFKNEIFKENIMKTFESKTKRNVQNQINELKEFLS